MVSVNTPSKPPTIAKPTAPVAAKPSTMVKAPLKGPQPTAPGKLQVKVTPQTAVPPTAEAIANADAVAPAPVPTKASIMKEKVSKPKAEKPPKVEKVFDVDEQTGLTIRNKTSFRWVCVKALQEVWTDLASFSQEAATEKCKEIYAANGGTKDISDEVWATQCNIMRAWLRSKGINKPLPGDIVVSTKTPEEKQAMLDRLAKGRANKAAKKGADASQDAQDEAEAAAEEV